MAEKIRVTMNSSAAAAILKSGPVEAFLKERANRIAAAAGEGMEASSSAGGSRARAAVVTVTNKAKAAEARDRALTKALDAGRG